VDTCAAEFAASTPYHYSVYEADASCESEVVARSEPLPKVLIIGSGPNRIGQGIEFDYSCVHASLGLREAGYETVMVNCNPETVSTDYDTSDRLYFEPLTFEDILEVHRAESAHGDVVAVIVQLGGQTPLRLAQRLAEAGLPIAGTSPEAIHRAEDRGSFAGILDAAGLTAPRHGVATSGAEAREIAARIGYPVLVRPSYVLGGRGMEVLSDEESLSGYLDRAVEVSPGHPLLVDEFLEDAIEIDVDALCDGTEVYLGGVMEHIEEAGVHSGDSACTLPPLTLGRADIAAVRAQTEAVAAGLGVCGMLNIQFALKDDVFYVLEANPRASRTVPFVAKATGVPLARAGARIMLGATIAELRTEGLLQAEGDGGELRPGLPVAVKEAVLPFHRFRTVGGDGLDSALGPEMRSTGEVMGIGSSFDAAYAKAQWAAGFPPPIGGRICVGADPEHSTRLVPALRTLRGLGFEILAEAATASVLTAAGITGVEAVPDGPDASPAVREQLGHQEFSLVVALAGHGPERPFIRMLRTCAAQDLVPYVTTTSGLLAAVRSIRSTSRTEFDVVSLQEVHENRRRSNSGRLDKGRSDRAR
jgi:carbamoyl-phosphate synthase large subunit